MKYAFDRGGGLWLPTSPMGPIESFIISSDYLPISEVAVEMDGKMKKMKLREPIILTGGSYYVEHQPHTKGVDLAIYEIKEVTVTRVNGWKSEWQKAKLGKSPLDR